MIYFLMVLALGEVAALAWITFDYPTRRRPRGGHRPTNPRGIVPGDPPVGPSGVSNGGRGR